MAGHSKWANIKHRKAGQDAKRGKVFTKLIRELTVAARQGGGSGLGRQPQIKGHCRQVFERQYDPGHH